MTPDQATADRATPPGQATLGQAKPDPTSRWILLFAALVFGVSAWRWGFILDELVLVRDLRLGFLEMIKARFHVGHTPLYFCFEWGWFRVVGESEFALRLPSVVAALVSVALFHRLVRRWSDSRSACFATLLLVVLPSQIYIASIARMYVMVQLLGLVTTALILRWEDRPRWRDCLVLSFLWLVGAGMHYSAALIAMAQTVYLVWRARPCWRLAAAAPISLAVGLPWLVKFASRPNTLDHLDWLPAADVASVLGYATLLVRPRGLWEPGSPQLVPVAVGLLLGALAVWGGLRGGRFARLLLCLWLVPLAAAVTVVAILPSKNILYTSRYFVVSMAAQAALLALAWKRSRAPALSWAILALVFVVPFLGGLGFRHRTAPEWRDAAHLVEAQRTAAEPVVVLGYELPIFTYYFPEPVYGWYLNDWAQYLVLDKDDHPRNIEEIPRDALTLWFLWDDVAMGDHRHLGNAERQRIMKYRRELEGRTELVKAYRWNRLVIEYRRRRE